MIDLGKETSLRPTESQYATATKLARIAWLSGRDRGRKFDCLMHHINRETLTRCFHELDGKKAVGADRVTKDEYGERLNENVSELIERMQSMAYKPGLLRRVLIPKEGKAGATRPIDIANFEDKLVQKATSKILESIYEPIFYKCSYGFRPGIGCHDAILDLQQYLFRNPVSVVVDVDLQNYFGSIKPNVLEGLLRQKIGDERFIRYIMRMIKAGILSEGQFQVSEEGLPQGSPISPILANVVAHCVIDEWFETTVRAHCSQPIAMFRYVDDLVICCASPTDAYRIRSALNKRLTKYNLEMNEEKTHMIRFSKTLAHKGKRQESFDFLGFTFYLGKTRKGHTIPMLKTSRKRLRSKLRRVKEWVKMNRSRLKLVDLWRIFLQKINGHIGYYSVSFNANWVITFIRRAIDIVFKWLNRRGCRKPISWKKFRIFMDRYPLPRVKLKHALFSLS